MNTKKVLIAVIVIFALVGAWMFLRAPKPDYSAITTFEQCAAAGYPIMESYPEQCKTPDGRNFVKQSPDYSNLIKVEIPRPNGAVANPMTILGQARGTWYFEASFPVKLLDANGVVLAEGHATAQGEWMTENFVPFTASLAYETPTTDTGTLILKNDNPSGDPSRDKELRIPVQFSKVPANHVSFGKPITLKIRDVVYFPNGQALSLIEINDSRCKPNVQCIWQGELSPLLHFWLDSEAPPGDEVRLGTVTKQSVVYDIYTVALQSATASTATIIVTINP